MKHADVIDCRLLYAEPGAAAISIAAERLHRPVKLQVLRLDHGLGRVAFSAYAAYTEGAMTFEASARLAVASPDEPPEALLRGLMRDETFLGSMLIPLLAEIDVHFGRRTKDRR